MIGFDLSPRTWAWVGVDIGLDGGVAVLFEDDSPPLVWRMPLAKRDGARVVCVNELSARLRGLQLRYDLVCAVEEPFLKGRQGGALTIGKNWGVVLAAFHSCDLKVELVRPQTWQDEVLAGIVGDDPKLRAAEYVRRHYSGVDLKASKKAEKDHDGIIDALCIADWRRRKTGGKVT